MMNVAIPSMVTVADLQRKYRSLVNKIKETGEPLVVVNKGKPDVVVMDAKAYNERVKMMRDLEEEYLLKVMEEAIEEHELGKTVKLKKGQQLIDLLS